MREAGVHRGIFFQASASLRSAHDFHAPPAASDEAPAGPQQWRGMIPRKKGVGGSRETSSSTPYR
jgi:hypothetical protein